MQISEDALRQARLTVTEGRAVEDFIQALEQVIGKRVGDLAVTHKFGLEYFS